MNIFTNAHKHNYVRSVCKSGILKSFLDYFVLAQKYNKSRPYPHAKKYVKKKKKSLVLNTITLNSKFYTIKISRVKV